MGFKEFVERLGADLWFTVTFRRSVSLDTAMKSFKRFFKFLNKPDKVYYEKFILSWVYFEKTIKGEGYHIHALIKGINPVLAPALEKECQKAFGLSKVKPYDHSRIIYPASEYLADKCVFNSDNLEFFRINSRLRRYKEVNTNETINSIKSY